MIIWLKVFIQLDLVRFWLKFSKDELNRVQFNCAQDKIIWAKLEVPFRFHEFSQGFYNLILKENQIDYLRFRYGSSQIYKFHMDSGVDGSIDLI